MKLAVTLWLWLGLAVGLAGCAPPVVVRDHETACRVVQQYVSRGFNGYTLTRSMSPADVMELSAPFPRAYAHAYNAYNTRIAAIVMTALGAAGLVGSFITGFLPNASDPNLRTGLYATVGVTIGLGVGALITGPIYVSQHNRAINDLGNAAASECPQ